MTLDERIRAAMLRRLKYAQEDVEARGYMTSRMAGWYCGGITALASIAEEEETDLLAESLRKAIHAMPEK